MIRSFFRSSIALLISVSLMACATAGDPTLAAARHSALKTRKTYLQGALAGAAIGAATGAGVGAIIGAQSNRTGPVALIGALVGTGVGTVGGIMVAQHVVKQRQAYANAELYLQDCTKIAAEQHASIQNYNRTLDTRLSVIRRDSTKLRVEIEGATALRAHLNNEIALQEIGLRQARSENVPEDLIGGHIAQLEALESDERNLTADLERLTAQDRANTLSSNP